MSGSVPANRVGDQVFSASVEAPPKQLGKDLNEGSFGLLKTGGHSRITPPTFFDRDKFANCALMSALTAGDPNSLHCHAHGPTANSVGRAPPQTVFKNNPEDNGVETFIPNPTKPLSFLTELGKSGEDGYETTPQARQNARHYFSTFPPRNGAVAFLVTIFSRDSSSSNSFFSKDCSIGSGSKLCHAGLDDMKAVSNDPPRSIQMT